MFAIRGWGFQSTSRMSPGSSAGFVALVTSHLVRQKLLLREWLWLGSRAADSVCWCFCSRGAQLQRARQEEVRRGSRLRKPQPQFRVRRLGSTPRLTFARRATRKIWEKHFAGTPHAALLKGGQHGCQACHGPGQAHVDEAAITKIIRFETLSPAQTAAICPSATNPAWRPRSSPSRSIWPTVSVARTCHSPHKSSDVNFMLVKPQTSLCYRMPCQPRRRSSLGRFVTGLIPDSSSAATATILTGPRG